MVATFDPGGAGYATFPVTNVWGVTPDSRNHQNSLDTAQPAPNADGTITIVLSNWDPGIASTILPASVPRGLPDQREGQLRARATGYDRRFTDR